MACEVVDHKRILFVLWGKPEHPDLDTIMRRAKDLYEKRGSFAFVARVPMHAEPPNEQLRKAIAKLLPSLMDRCVSYNAVMEGGGFVSSAKRAILATVFLMSPHRSKYHIHSCTNEVLEALPASLRADWMGAIAQLEPRGLLGRNLRSIFPPGRMRASAAPPPM